MITALSLLATLGLAPMADPVADPVPTLETPPVIRVEFSLPATAVVAYPQATELRERSTPRLSEVAQEAWDDEFINESYFTAFAYARSGGFGYATLSNTPEAARDVALQQCLSVNESCKIIAEIVPDGYRQLTGGQIGLTPLMLNVYEETMAGPRFRAMAISADGAYSGTWDHPTQAAADAHVTEGCNGHRNQAFPGLQDYPCILLPGLE